MSRFRILVAEDDANIRCGLIDTLESEGYEAVAAEDGEAAIQLYGKESFSLLLLDIMMPGKNGYDVCREIRKRDAQTPIIMLTAKGEELDKVLGLELGADDYVTKPFGIHELLARVGAALRRASRTADGNRDGNDACFIFGDMEIDTRTFEARRGNHTVALSAREVALVCFFHRHPNEVLSRDDILNAVWGIDYLGTTRTLDQHIAQLRKKIEANPASPALILTVHGVGYRYAGILSVRQ